METKDDISDFKCGLVVVVRWGGLSISETEIYNIFLAHLGPLRTS